MWLKKIYSFCLFLTMFNISLFAQQPRLVLPIGHTKYVASAHFSPDKRKIVSASGDNTVKLWDAFNGILLADLMEHSSFVNSVQFSPNGKKIVSASADKTAKVWEVNTGICLFTITGHTEAINSAQFSADGKKIVSASADKTAKVWDASTGKLLVNLRGHMDAVNSAQFSADGKRIVTSSDDKTAKIWNVETGLMLINLKASSTIVRSAQFSPDGKKIITVSDDSTARIWETGSGKLLVELKRHTSYIYSAQFSLDGKKIVTASQDGTAKVWDVMNGEMITDLMANTLALKSTNSTVVSAKVSVQYAEFSPDGSKIVTASADNSVKIWDGITGNQLFDLAGHGKAVLHAAFSSDGKKIVSSSEDYTSKVWDVANGKLLADLKGHSTTINKARFDRAANKLITTSWDNTAKVWNLINGTLVADLKGHTAAITSGEFSADGNKIVTTSLDKTAKIWDASNGILLADLKGHIDAVYSAQFSPDGLKVVTSSWDNASIVWDVATGKSLIELVYWSPLASAEFSPDGKNILMISEDNAFMIWDAVTGNKLLDLNNFIPQIQSARYSANGKKIIIISGDRSINLLDANTGVSLLSIKNIVSGVRMGLLGEEGKKIIAVLGNNTVGIWDAASGVLLSKLKGIKQDIKEALFSPDEKKIITISDENKITIWDVAKGTPIASLKKEHTQFKFGHFSPDNKKVLTAAIDNTISIWNAESGKLVYTFFPVDQTDYFAQIPTGFYQTTPSAAKLLHYVSKDLKVITFEQLDVKYNRPDKVLEAIGSTDTALIKSYRKALEKRIKKLGIDTTAFRDGYSVPGADFSNRDAIEYEQKTGVLKLTIKGNDSTYKLDRFNVWVNETPLYGQRGINIRRRNKNVFDTTITIKLSQGENRIESSITNVNGTESYRMPLTVNYSPAVQQKETTHFIGIGIDQFADDQFNLLYSSKDIRDLARNLKEKYKDDIVIDTLFNETVTVANVKALKQKLLQTTENDKVIIAYSGHGMLSKDYDYYLSTYSVNFENPEENGLPYDELENLLDSIPARKKLMLIDACHSGEVDKEDLITLNASSDSLIKGFKPIAYKKEGQLGLKNSFELMQSLFVNVGKSTGATIISAAAGTQFALERNDLKNGVFTYSILEAMNKYPTITISELKKYVGERVTVITKGAQKPTSRNETIAVDWTLW